MEMSPHPDPLPALMYQYCFNSAGRGNERGAMPFLMSFALEPEIVTLAWIDNASVQFPLNIYATKGLTLPPERRPPARRLCADPNRERRVGDRRSAARFRLW